MKTSLNYHALDKDKVCAILKVNGKCGKTDSAVKSDLQKYGYNVLKKENKKTLFSKILCALSEPMMVILIISFLIAFFTKLGSYMKTHNEDFTECIGILVAIVLSVSITIIMEGSSEKAFETLNKIYDNVSVKVYRNGEIAVISQKELTVGDIVLIESGDKIVADGRLIYDDGLMIDESALTGESISVKKNSGVVLGENVPIHDRVNCVFSGTYVTGGNGKMIVCATGDHTEIGKIASELVDKGKTSPLEQKLSKLGKTISLFGSVLALFVFVISMVKLYNANSLSFENIQTLFISCIVLIVAAVPEGLPTIVALSLALNMIKLSKENALIKKMTATETMGAVSVICSDKTGTLTQNKMTVKQFCTNSFCSVPEKISSKEVLENFILNSTAEITVKGKVKKAIGNASECALLTCADAIVKDYLKFREGYQIVKRIPFNSDNKYMITVVKGESGFRTLVKGAPERVLDMCALTSAQKKQIMAEMKVHEENAERILCFAHADYNFQGTLTDAVYDGYVTISDPIRKETVSAVRDAQKAGIKVKILTGDNPLTAKAIAKQLNILESSNQVVCAKDLENLSDEDLKKILPKISVIARSTPLTKLRVVKLLKEMGEVVAVTGDGINDAPAIKQADVGIAMGISGSEITKEAAGVVLLDDSFATIVKSVSFGRNIYVNLQRFILFQLSVNVSALIFIVLCSVLGYTSPFNTMQLLWINIIMDGPPALTLGFEKAGNIMDNKPVKRNDSIVSRKMLLRIIFNGVFVAGVVLKQYFSNFLRVSESELNCSVFTLFILFQLFNAFNCRELGSKSILSSIGKNKIMALTFLFIFVLHIIVVNYIPNLFGVNAISLVSTLKCILTAFSIIVVSEFYKLMYRWVIKIKSKNVCFASFRKNINKNRVKA